MVFINFSLASSLLFSLFLYRTPHKVGYLLYIQWNHYKTAHHKAGTSLKLTTAEGAERFVGQALIHQSL